MPIERGRVSCLKNERLKCTKSCAYYAEATKVSREKQNTRYWVEQSEKMQYDPQVREIFPDAPICEQQLKGNVGNNDFRLQ